MEVGRKPVGPNYYNFYLFLDRHVTVGLHWVQSVIRKWWPELSKAEKRLQDSCSEDRSVHQLIAG